MDETVAAGGISEAPKAPPKVVCRPIVAEDLDRLVDLLVSGFPERPRPYWQRGFERMAARPVPEGCQRYGHVLETGGELVGCLLVIYGTAEVDGLATLRGNVSSWYVRPDFRAQASLLVSVVFRRKDITFVNISPAPHTVPILDAQGYKNFVAGQFIALLSPVGVAGSSRVTAIGADYSGPLDGRVPELALLRRHAGYGCISVVCSRGDAHEPFVFTRRTVLRAVPAAQLVYCRDIAYFRDHFVSLSRFLLRRGLAFASIDANGAMPGLAGVYRAGNGPKFFRGPHRPRLGDLADTELVVLGG
jgi:hypothetical protein